MWTPFIQAAILLVALIYLPGMLFLRGLRARWDVAIMAAPALTIAFYSVRPILQARSGAFTTWGSLFYPALAIGIIVFVAGCILTYFVHIPSAKELRARRTKASGSSNAELGSSKAPSSGAGTGEAVQDPDAATGEVDKSGSSPSITLARLNGFSRRALANGKANGHSLFSKVKPGDAPAAEDEDDDEPRRSRRLFHGVIMLMYVAVGVVAAYYVFLSHMSTPDVFVTLHDNQHHLNSIQNFLDSGNWSSLGLTVYRGDISSVAPFTGKAQFYPSAWHVLCAMVASAAGVSVPMAANVVNTVFIAVIYPLGTCLALLALFPESKRVASAGSVVCLGFVAFPWILLVRGIMSPQLVSLAVVPLALGALLLLFEERSAVGVVRNLIVLAASVVAIILLNTTSLFTAVVLLAFAGASRIYRLIADIKQLKFVAKPLGIVAAMIVLYVVYRIWVWGPDSGLVDAVVRNSDKDYASIAQAVFDTVSMRLTGDAPQYLMLVLVLCGVGYLIYKREFWLIAPIAFLGIAFTISAGSFESEPMRLFFTGYWYRDPLRIAASFAVCAALVAACGLYAITETIAGSVRRLCMDKRKRMPHIQTVTALICIVAAIVIFIPDLPALVDYDAESRHEKQREKAESIGQEVFEETEFLTDEEEYTRARHGIPYVVTAFGGMIDEIAFRYDAAQEYEYESDEWEFSKKVVDIIGDELVLNETIDGSVYAYGAHGVNTYYRYNSGYGGSGEVLQSAVIRNRLCDISWDSEVQEAVRWTGAHYVLLYDMGEYKHAQRSYNTPEYWRGFENITTSTPGFEVVLQDGEKALLRITAVD